MDLSGFMNKMAGNAVEDQLVDKCGDLAKQGAKVVIDKIQGGGAEGADGAGGADQEQDKGKGGLLGDFLGGDDDKKDGGGGFDIGNIGNLASDLLKK